MTLVDGPEVPAPVYNLEIEEYHTYLVGSALWGFAAWAHNNDCAIAPAAGALSEPGALRNAAVDVHNLAGTAANRVPINQSTVAIVEGKVGDELQLFASGSGGYPRPGQVERLTELGVPSERILSGAQFSKGFSAAENHAERVILRNLPEGASVTRWGISWGGQQRAVPCPVCEPFVNLAGGILEGT